MVLENKKLEIGDHIVTRENGVVTVEVPGGDWLADFGASPVNADGKRWRKVFNDKVVFFPDEYDLAVRRSLSPDQNTFVMSMNGYSELKPDFLSQYGIPVGAYEEACSALFIRTGKRLIKEFPSVRLVTADGASDMGIDKAIHNAILRLDANIPTLGFSCPQYLPYVADGDGFPVFLGNDKEDYSHKYIATLDLLITTGGRQHAFEMDTVASILYDTRMHFVDILSELSMTGDVPAKTFDSNGKPVIQNAAAAMGKIISFYDRSDARLLPNQQDRWDHLFENVGNVATGVCRQKMPVGYRF